MTYAATIAERIDEARKDGIATLERHSGLNWQAFAYLERYSPAQAAFAKRSIAARYGRVMGAPRQLLLARALRLTGAPEDGYAQAAGNLLVTAGLGLITQLLIGTTTSGSIKNAQAICGVGSSSTAAAVGDTHLGGDGSTTTAYYQQADATFPTQSAGVMTMQSTFASGNANFAWNEWCWASCTSGTITAGGTLASVATGVTMWNHKVPASSLGTKASGAAWVFTTTITLS